MLCSGNRFLIILPCQLGNKYSHAAVWPLVPGHDILNSDGVTIKRNYPVAVMVANLAKETPERPALMLHDDVVTFFHEMGHAMHCKFYDQIVIVQYA